MRYLSKMVAILVLIMIGTGVVHANGTSCKKELDFFKLGDVRVMASLSAVLMNQGMTEKQIHAKSHILEKRVNDPIFIAQVNEKAYMKLLANEKGLWTMMLKDNVYKAYQQRAKQIADTHQACLMREKGQTLTMLQQK